MVWKKGILCVASAALLVLPSLASRAEALTADQLCEKRKSVALNKYNLCAAKKIELARIGLAGGNFLAPCQQRRRGQLERAGPCRFVDNGDGTITDLDLGLMWEQKTTANVEDLYDDWATAASEYVSKVNGSTPGLGNRAALGAHNDWRLPSFGELFSTVKISCPNEGTPCVSNPIFLPIHSGVYWTIEGPPFSEDPTKATVIDYLLGLSNVERPKTEAHAVRLVRSIYKVE